MSVLGGAPTRRAILLSLPLFLLAVPAPSGELAGTVTLVPGIKLLDEDEWKPVEQQLSIAVETSWGGKSWPVHVAADLGISMGQDTTEGIEFTGWTTEFSLGVRRMFGRDRFRPYAGAGAALVRAEIEASGFGDTLSDSDSSAGVWIGGGLLWRVASRFHVGLAARYSTAKVTLADVEGDAGGAQLGLALAWAWPSRPKRM